MLATGIFMVVWIELQYLISFSNKRNPGYILNFTGFKPPILEVWGDLAMFTLFWNTDNRPHPVV